ncbi:MAG: hypothetical protein HY319_31110 [Armatimonadetes bacterium]|nr:hypothetical protein [Armatimonadota bacterium]
MGIHIHDLPEDLDPGQLSTLQGGSFSWGLYQPSATGIGTPSDSDKMMSDSDKGFAPS